MHFPQPCLPATPSREYMLDLLDDVQWGIYLRTILKRLDPQFAQEVPLANSQALVAAVQDFLSQRFPVYEWPDYLFDDGMTLYDIVRGGIPVNLQGFSVEDSSSPALIVAALTTYSLEQGPERSLNDLRLSLNVDLPKNPTWWRGSIPKGYKIRQPRGRRFAGLWAALPDLIAYVTNETENFWLDSNDCDECYHISWDEDEIKALTVLWKKAEPVLKQVMRLAKFISASPDTHLPLLHHAIWGDPAALHRISKPAVPPKRKGNR